MIFKGRNYKCNPSPSQGDSAGKEWVTEFSSPHQGGLDTRVADREQFKKKGQTSRVLPFGLCNAPATFQRVMNTILAGLIYKCCAVYLDDIVIASPTFEQHLLDLREVFLRLEKAGLTLKPGKCQFCWKELKFLGYKVSPDGILPDSDKIDAVLKFPVPTDVKQVRQFLGLTSYYRRFIHNYAQFAEPLFALTRHDTPFMWDRECQDAMDYLKTRLTLAPILNFPDFDRPFSLHTDACDMGLGAALMQRDEVGREVAIAYAS
ncbi:hypothetical protein NFI96_025165 [Prochilodus magdalenae]|nr:hypothetical protein NFI96_025165 [Prochilodus magdalenae]